VHLAADLDAQLDACRLEGLHRQQEDRQANRRGALQSLALRQTLAEGRRE
jgi:hypothetical protein